MSRQIILKPKIIFYMIKIRILLANGTALKKLLNLIKTTQVEDVIRNKRDPSIIAQYKYDSGEYTIPEFNNQTNKKEKRPN